MIVLLTMIRPRPIILARRPRGGYPAPGPGSCGLGYPAGAAPKDRRSAMQLFGLCLNWKVIAGLAIAALGVLVLAPQLLAAALPVLILAACPLSMLLMMRGMGNMNGMGTTNGIGAADGAETADTLPGSAARAVAGAPQRVDETVDDLRRRLERVQAEQDMLVRRSAALHSRRDAARKLAPTEGSPIPPHTPATTAMTNY